MRIMSSSVLITGGSRGLGAALGLELARRGARVVLVARGREELERKAAEIRAQGFEAHALVADVGKKEAIHPLAGAAAALVGPIDLLIHNASTLGPTPLRELLDTECEDFQSVLEVNLLGPFRLTKVIAGSMLLRKRGLILSLSSDAAINGYPTWGAYGVSKAALDHLMRTWAAELEESDVRFVSLDPGEMDTRMHADAMPDADRASLRAPEVVARAIVDRIEAGELPTSGGRVELMAEGSFA